MPSSRSCSCASSSRASVLRVRDDGLQLARPLDQRGPLVGRRRPHRGRGPLGLRTGLVAAVDRGVARGEQLLQRGDVQRVAAPGELPHGVGGGVEQDAGVVHRSRLSPGRERVSGAPSRRGGVGPGAEAGCARCDHMWLSEESPCPPPSRRTPPAPPTSRCSATRSGTTSTAPPPGTRRRGPRRRRDRPPLDLRASSSPDVRRAGARTAPGGGPKGDRVGIWAPNVAEWAFVQYATAKIGAILVNINPAYRTHELEYVLNQSGVALLVAARSFKTSDYAGMIEEVRPRCPELKQVVLLGSSEWDALARGNGDRDELARVQASLSTDDPINIQYTSGTTGFPKGATLSHHNIVNNGYFVGSLCGYTEADRVCIPVPFYHCFGMVMGNLGCTTHGATMVIPAPGLRPGRDAARRRPGAVHLALRRADDVHRRAGRPRLRLLRPVVAAHRDHGGLAVPGGGDEAGRRPDGHDRGDHLLRHDRDLAGVHADPRRRHAGPARLHRRPGAPARRGQGRRPG